MPSQLALDLDPHAQTDADANVRPGSYSIPEIKVLTVRDCTVQEEQAKWANDPQAVVDLFRSVTASAPWFDPEKECVVVFVLNRRNRVVGHNLVSLGSATAALCSPREVLRPVLALAGTAFVLCHNHPSGDPAASPADITLTRSIRTAAATMEFDFLDHVIIGDARFDPARKGLFSFRAAGII